MIHSDCGLFALHVSHSQHILPMKLQVVALTLRKRTHIHSPAYVYSHALQ
jgi:hypothetical protein